MKLVIWYELFLQGGTRSRRRLRPPPHPFDPLTNLSANREESPEQCAHTHTSTAGRGRGGPLALEHARHVEAQAGSTCCRLEAGWHSGELINTNRITQTPLKDSIRADIKSHWVTVTRFAFRRPNMVDDSNFRSPYRYAVLITVNRDRATFFLLF